MMAFGADRLFTARLTRINILPPSSANTALHTIHGFEAAR